MIKFLKNIFEILNPELRPDMEFETINPIIEIYKFIFNVFGLVDYQYRRTVMFKGSKILAHIEAFSQPLFNFLLSSMRCSWESVRQSSLEILQGYPDDFELVTPQFLTQFLIPSALELTKNPVIKNAEGGALILSFIIRKYILKVDFKLIKDFKVPQHLNTHPPADILFAYYLLHKLEERFIEMQKSLLEDS